MNQPQPQMNAQPPANPRRRYSIGSIIVLIVLVGVLVSFYVYKTTGKPPAIVQKAVDEASEATAPAPTVVVDENMSISAGGMQLRGFTLNRPTVIRVEVAGVRDTAKGFDVYVIRQEEWENVRNERDFRHIPKFQGLKVTKMTETHELPAGSWGVVVRNSYNLMNSMEVQLKVIADPPRN